MTSRFKKTPRWQWETRIWRFNLDASRHINRECITLGFCLNWNYKPSLEVDFLLWTLHIEYQP